MPTPESCAAPHLYYHATHKLAIFVDIENFAGYCADLEVPVDIAPLLAYLTREFGRIQIKRSFGDVSSLPRVRFNSYEIRRMLQYHQVEHIDIPHRPTSYSKNSADIRLVVDAVALIHQRPDITHFVVFSNDRDFIPLFNHAREHGRTVIGCGPARNRVAEDYLNACDIFLYQEDFVEVPKPVQVVLSVPPAAPVPPAPTLAPATTLAPTPAPSFVPEASQAPTAAPAQTPESLAVSAAWPALATPDEQVHLGRLMTTLHSLRDDGMAAVASQVSLRMKQLFPEFDVKREFGSFKLFCLTQEKTGRIRLINPDQPTFEVELTDPGAFVPSAPPAASSSAHDLELLNQYRDWALRKIRVPVPLVAVRELLYAALMRVLQRRHEQAESIPLHDLGRLIGAELVGVVANPDVVAYRICYGLYRSKAFYYRQTADSFNPDIIDLAVPLEALDQCFVVNTRKSFLQDKHGLPFDAGVFARFLEGEGVAPSVTPPPAPVAEPEPELIAEPAIEAIQEPVVDAVTEVEPVLALEPEMPEPTAAPVQEPEQEVQVAPEAEPEPALVEAELVASDAVAAEWPTSEAEFEAEPDDYSDATLTEAIRAELEALEARAALEAETEVTEELQAEAEVEVETEAPAPVEPPAPVKPKSTKAGKATSKKAAAKRPATKAPRKSSAKAPPVAPDTPDEPTPQA